MKMIQMVNVPPGIGNPAGRLKISVFGDLQCPQCYQASLPLQKLLAIFKEEIYLQYRYFPNTCLYEKSLIAAMAAEAAHLQGRFWLMAHLLLRYQSRITGKSIYKIARAAGLATQKFKADFITEKTYRTVQEDYEEGEKAGVRTTPTFVLDDQLIAGEAAVQSLFKACSRNLSPGASATWP